MWQTAAHVSLIPTNSAFQVATIILSWVGSQSDLANSMLTNESSSTSPELTLYLLYFFHSCSMVLTIKLHNYKDAPNRSLSTQAALLKKQYQSYEYYQQCRQFTLLHSKTTGSYDVITETRVEPIHQVDTSFFLAAGKTKNNFESHAVSYAWTPHHN